MIEQIYTYFSIEMIYLWLNFGVLPFWFLLLIAPNHNLTKILVHSVIAPLLLATAYIFVAYKIYVNGNIFGGFDLYFGLDNLYSVYSEESFLLIFWLHFVALNLFLGSWMSRDGVKYNMSRSLMCVPLILVYFTELINCF